MASLKKLPLIRLSNSIDNLKCMVEPSKPKLFLICVVERRESLRISVRLVNWELHPIKPVYFGAVPSPFTESTCIFLRFQVSIDLRKV